MRLESDFFSFSGTGKGRERERDKTHVSSCHGSQLGVRIVRRSDFDNIGRDDVEAVQTAQDRAQLTRRPT